MYPLLLLQQIATSRFFQDRVPDCLPGGRLWARAREIQDSTINPTKLHGTSYTRYCIMIYFHNVLVGFLTGRRMQLIKILGVEIKSSVSRRHLNNQFYYSVSHGYYLEMVWKMLKFITIDTFISGKQYLYTRNDSYKQVTVLILGCAPAQWGLTEGMVC